MGKKKKKDNLGLGLNDRRLLLAVDSVEELADVESADSGQARAVEVSSRLRDLVNVRTLNEDGVLGRCVLLDCHTISHRHLENLLASQHVPDLSRSPVVSDDNVDGEVGVDGPHLVLPSNGETLSGGCNAS